MIDLRQWSKYIDASGIIDLADLVVVVLQSGRSAKVDADELLKHFISPARSRSE